MQTVRKTWGLPPHSVRSSLQWWIARRLRANVNLVSAQKISPQCCVPARQYVDAPPPSSSQLMFYWLTICCLPCPGRAARLTAKCSPVTRLKTACLHVTGFRYMYRGRCHRWQGSGEEAGVVGGCGRSGGRCGQCETTSTFFYFYFLTWDVLHDACN